MMSLRRGISPEGFINIAEVAKRLGVGKTTAWGIAKDCPDFPTKRKFGTRTTRWRADEIDAWIKKQIAATDEAAAHEQKT